MSLLLVSEVVRALLVQGLDDDGRAALDAVWDVMTRGVGEVALWLVAGGAVLAAAATWTRDPATMRTRLGEAAHAMRPPESAIARIGGGVGFVIFGLLLIFNAEQILVLVAAAVGVAFVTIGLAVAVATGLVPFLPVDIFKILVAAAVMPPIWQLIGRHRC